jgi:thioredoxin reductase (NADPH)
MYASRQGLKTLVITKDIGGQALLTNDIENYPPFEHVGGFELMQKFEQQARSFGAEFAYEEVLSITEQKEEDRGGSGGGFTVKTNNNNNEYSGRALILAFGKTPKDLNVKGEKELGGKGVSYCAVCDGPFFKNKKVAIVGAGDQALEAAIYLKELASQLYIIHRTDKPVGSEESIDLLQNKDNNNNTKISFVSNSIVKAINGNSKVESLTVYDSKTKYESKLDVDGIFVEMGYVARTDIVKDLVKLNSSKEIIVDKYCGTSTKGIFAAGDVTDVPYKQAIISAGQGAIAALSAYNYLQRLKGKPAIRTDWKSVVNERNKKSIVNEE